MILEKIKKDSRKNERFQPGDVVMFLLPTSWQVLVERMLARGTETAETVQDQHFDNFATIISGPHVVRGRLRSSVGGDELWKILAPNNSVEEVNGRFLKKIPDDL